MKQNLKSISRVVRGLVPLCIVAVLVVACLACVGAQRRGASSQTNRTSPHTITLGASEDLQAAIDDAQPGDTIMLPPGAMYRGAYNLPNKGASEAFITIRSAASEARLPQAGERLDPARHAAHLPAIASAKKDTSALTATGGAHHYRFIAVRFAASPDGGGNIVALGTSGEKKLADLPHHIEFDRTYFHGDAIYGQRRGIALNGRDIRIVNSYFKDFKRKDDESQAICGWNGSGNYLIENNYIEAAGENIMFGGADSSIPDLVPSDIVIRRNHFTKPLAWKTQGWVVKNLLELKNAQRVTISGNLFENCWAAAQGGTAIVITPRNQDGGARWSAVRDIEFSHNIVRDVTNGIGILGRDYTHPSQPSERIQIVNNLFYRLGGEGAAGGRGEWVGFMGTGGKDITIKHNTALTPESGMGMRADDASGFVNVTFEDNIFRAHLLHSGEVGTGAMERLAGRAWQVRKNVIAHPGNRAADYPANNFLTDNFAQIGFVNSVAGDFSLRPDSKFVRRATDKSNPGCDTTRLVEALRAGAPAGGK